MEVSYGVKCAWPELPSALRAHIESLLGAAVVAAETQPGGFTPGLSARVVTTDGRRVFLKAVSEQVNAVSAAMHRFEATVTAALPGHPSLPRLLWSSEHEGWVVLCFADVDGRNPRLPWRLDDLDRMLASLAELHEVLTPAPVAVPAIGEAMGESFHGWRRFAHDPVASKTLDPWARERIDELASSESGWEPAAGGETLVHADIRADQVLLTAERVVFVDWAQACRAAPWVDVVFLLPSVGVHEKHDLEALLGRSPTAAVAPPDAVTAILTAVTGYFLWAAQLPAPPGLPTVRTFQKSQGDVALRWLRDRLSA